MAGFWKGLGWIMGEGLKSTVDSIKEKVSETIAEMEEKIEKATIKVIKTATLFLMMFVGGLFMLIGFAQYLNETIPNLAHGLGTVLVGAVLVLLALFVRMMK